MPRSRYRFLKVSTKDLEELDYTICSQKRKLMTIIDTCVDNEDIKFHLETLDNLSKIQDRVRDEMNIPD